MKTTLRILAFAFGLCALSASAQFNAPFTVPIYFTNFTMVGTTNDTTINIKALNNPIGYLESIYSLPPRGINITTTNGVGVARLVVGRYTASFAGIPQSWFFTVTNSATPLNVLDITEGDSGIQIYSGVQTLTGKGGITIYPPTGAGGNWAISNNPASGGSGTNGGTVVGPNSSVANHIAVYADGTGQLLSDLGIPVANIVLQANYQALTNALGSAAFHLATDFITPAQQNVLSNSINGSKIFGPLTNNTTGNATTATTSTQLENRGTTVNGFQAAISTAGNNGFHITDADGSAMGITGGNILIIWTNASAIVPFALRGIDNIDYLKLSLTNAFLPTATIKNLGDGSNTNLTVSDLNGGLHIARMGSHLTWDGTTIDTTGVGGGDMLAANNLSDVGNKASALATLGGAPTNYGTTLEKRFANGAFMRTNTAPPFNWEFRDTNGLVTFGTNNVTKLTLSKNGDITVVGNLGNIGNGSTFTLDGSPASSPGPFTFDATTTSVLKMFGPVIGEMMELNADAQQVTFFYRIFSVGSIAAPSLTIDQWLIATNTANHSLVISNTTYQTGLTIQTNNVLLIGPNAAMTTNQAIDATALGANMPFIGTGASTNMVQNLNGLSLTNTEHFTNFAGTTNIVLPSDGLKWTGLITNAGPDIFISFAGNNVGPWSLWVTTNTLHLPPQVKMLGYSNVLATNQLLDIQFFGGTNRAVGAQSEF